MSKIPKKKFKWRPFAIHDVLFASAFKKQGGLPNSSNELLFVVMAPLVATIVAVLLTVIGLGLGLIEVLTNPEAPVFMDAVRGACTWPIIAGVVLIALIVPLVRYSDKRVSTREPYWTGYKKRTFPSMLYFFISYVVHAVLFGLWLWAARAL